VNNECQRKSFLHIVCLFVCSVLYIIVCLLSFFVLVIVSSVLRFTVSDYPLIIRLIFFKAQISPHYEITILNLFVLLVALARTGTILLVVRERYTIKTYNFRIKSGMCKRSIKLDRAALNSQYTIYVHCR
jgi:hypothetical protein